MFEGNESPERAQKIFNLLVETFAEQGISPTPLNYYVWYEYYKGKNTQLRNELDAILDDPFGYNDRVGRRLYETYLVEDDTPSSEFDRAFKRLIEMMVKKMDAWSDRLETHTKELDSCTDRLSNPDLDSDEIREITSAVLNTATSMKESSQAFQDQMLNSTDSVRELRKQLVEARAEAMKDELTEIGNRKAFNIAIEELMIDAENNPESLCLALTDIDHFKQFNDTYGHLVGDSVLRYFASIMTQNKNDNEIICRYGGEEFAILFANSNLDDAIQRSEEIREKIQSAHLKRKNSSEPLKTITASFGVAAYKGSADSVKSFIDRADKALYKAKKEGRNRVINETELEKDEN